MNPGNIRDMQVEPGKGKDVKDTRMLTGTAKEVADWNADNVTKEYKTGGPGFDKGNLGGENTFK